MDDFLWVGGFDTDVTERYLLNYFRRSFAVTIFRDQRGTSLGHAKVFFRSLEHGMLNFN